MNYHSETNRGNEQLAIESYSVAARITPQVIQLVSFSTFSS